MRAGSKIEITCDGGKAKLLQGQEGLHPQILFDSGEGQKVEGEDATIFLLDIPTLKIFQKDWDVFCEDDNGKQLKVSSLRMKYFYYLCGKENCFDYPKETICIMSFDLVLQPKRRYPACGPLVYFRPCFVIRRG